MRRLLALAAVPLVGACSGGDDTATETVTVTVATTTTATVTETATETTTQGPTGTLPVDAFNARAESVDEPWERDIEATTDEFLGRQDQESGSRSFQSTSNGNTASAFTPDRRPGRRLGSGAQLQPHVQPPTGRHLADRVCALGAALPARTRAPGVFAGALHLAERAQRLRTLRLSRIVSASARVPGRPR